jgi:hypothetical protein
MKQQKPFLLRGLVRHLLVRLFCSEYDEIMSSIAGFSASSNDRSTIVERVLPSPLQERSVDEVCNLGTDFVKVTIEFSMHM